ncbi:MAG: oxaloacetate decarboxylase gamma subunit [Porticoccaceae bacterium]|jgi:oxaloacetate decarboxylase gamma subunit
MLAQGINLMFYGMGTVFVFLTLLVFFTTVMSTIITRFFSSVELSPPVIETRNLGQLARRIPDQTLLLVLESAIAQHRQR